MFPLPMAATSCSPILRSNSRRGERIALLGENGSGKSSLFRLLARQELPIVGQLPTGAAEGWLPAARCATQSGTPLDLLGDVRDAGFDCSDPGHTRIPDDRTAHRQRARRDVLDQYNAALAQEDALSQVDGDDAIADVLAGIGLPEAVWDVPFGMLSGGEKKMVGIARFLTQQPDVLLLDEPDNHLDVRAKGWLEEFLAHYPGAVGIITHDRYLIDRVATGIVELEDGKGFDLAEAATPPTGCKSGPRLSAPSSCGKWRSGNWLGFKSVSRTLRSGPGRTPGLHRVPKTCAGATRWKRRSWRHRPRPTRRARINVSFEASRGGAWWW